MADRGPYRNLRSSTRKKTADILNHLREGSIKRVIRSLLMSSSSWIKVYRSYLLEDAGTLDRKMINRY